MAADRSRLAAALAYEEERRRRMMESVPGLVTTPAQPAPRANFRTNLENLSIGLGEGLTNQLEGVKSIVTDPVGTARGVYEAGKAVIRDPSVIADALRYTAEKATSGPLGAGEVIGEMLGPRKGGPVMQELDVYHGTPHKFPATEANPLGEFDASKIGTGEGGSVYGKGIYFTSSPKFAKEFARHVGEPRLSLKGQELERGTPDYEAAMLVDSMGLQQAQKYVKRATTDESEKISGHFKTIDAALANITKKSDVKNLGLGQIYKADLPDEMIEKMIVYDKPIKKQSNYVKAALEKAGINTQTEAYAGPVIQGQEKAIAAAGIPGMVYREKGGPRNFVVFPGEEKKVRILERDGQKAPPQKIAQALETTLKNQNLVDVFNKTAKREIESINKRIVDPDEVHLTHQPITNLENLDQITDPIFNYAKASVLKKIGEQNGFNVKLEGSNVSPSVYAKFTKVNDDGLIDFKVRISDHADVSRNKPIGEKKAYDINPDSNGSMQEIIQLLNDPNWLKQFYELD